MADRWYYAGYSGSASTGKTLKLHIYTIETNIIENYTVERADLIMEVTNATGSYWNNYGSPAYVGINGNNTTHTVKWDARSTGDKWLIGSWDTRVYHRDDGSQWIGISFSHTTNTSLGNAICSSDTYICDTIPRQANITGANNFNDEQNPYLTFNNNGGFQLNAKLEFSGLQIVRNNIPNTGNYTFQLTENERNILRNAANKSNSLTIRYVIATVVDGAEKWWSLYDKTMSIINANPIFNNFEFKDINEITLALTGDNQKIIKNYSNIEAIISTANKAVAQKMATMSKYRLQIGTKQVDINYSDDSDVPLTLNKVDNNVVRVYAIDSRNNSTAKDLSPLDFIEYTDIKILSASVNRSNNGVGSIVTLNLEGEFWNDNFGIISNTIKSLKVQYKLTTSNDWISGDTITPDINGNKFSKEITIKGDLGAEGFDVNNSYDIRIIVEDELSTFVFTTILGSGKPAMAISRYGVSFGSPYNENVGGLLQLNGRDVELKIVTGQEIPTNEYLDGKQVFVKRIEFGNLPNSTEKIVTTDLKVSETDIYKFEGLAGGSIASGINYRLVLPDINPAGPEQATRITFDSENDFWRIKIRAGIDRSNYTAKINIYYIRN